MSESQGKKLDGWKAIAEYLGKDASTATRWARSRGMPIHRPPGGKGATVYAYPDELDAWLDHSNNSNLAPAAGSDMSQHSEMKRRWVALSRRYKVLLGLALLLVFVAFLVLASRSARFPSHVSFSGNKLLALDERERLVWEYDFRNRIEKLGFESAQKPRFVDLDGDGQQEILIATAFADEPMRDVHREKVYCFSPDGQVLWSYEPNLTLSFGGRQYEGPWLITDILTDPARSHYSAWLSVTHHTWWPSFLVKLDLKGQPSVQFIDSGAMYALTYVRNDTGSYVLAGGVNNEYSAGMLAVINERHPPAVSPQSPGSAYVCDNCPEGHAYRYFLFPRSELNVLEGRPYNPVRNVLASESQIEIWSDEVPPLAPLMFRMTTDFQLKSVAMSDGYAELHRRLSQQGKIAHSLRECPSLRQPYTVRVWDAEHGWSEIPIPWAPGPKE